MKTSPGDLRLCLTRPPWGAIADLWLEPGVEDAFELSDELRLLILEELEARFGDDFHARRNICASQRVWAVRSGWALGELSDPRDNYQVTPLRWGLIPGSAPSRRLTGELIAARVEAIAQRPLLAALVDRQRCLILADGFYAFERVQGRRRAHRFSLEGFPVFAIAGVWDEWISPDGEELIASCAILTHPADGALASFHDRAPVILPPERWRGWLAPHVSRETLLEVLDVAPPPLVREEFEELRPDHDPRHARREAPAQLDLIAMLEREQRARLEDRSRQLALFSA